MNRKQDQDGLTHAFARWILLLAGAALLGACAAPPEMAYPTGQGKRSLIGAAARGQPSGVTDSAQVPVVLAHDAADIQRLSDALAQLRTQLSDAMGGWRPNLPGSPLAIASPKSALVVPSPEANHQAPAKMLNVAKAAEPATGTSSDAKAKLGNVMVASVPIAPVVPIKGLIQVNPPALNVAFQLDAVDTTLLGVLWRWTHQMGWQMRLNGTLVDGDRFPVHPVAYTDVGLERSSELAAPGQALEPALGALLQAHAGYQEQLDFTLALLSDKTEISVQSVSRRSPLTKPATEPMSIAQAPAR